MRGLALLATLLASSTAVAEGLAPSESVQEHRPAGDHPYAVAINEPFGWPSGFAIAASGYAAPDAHNVVRLNVATYGYHGNLGAEVIGTLVFHGESETGYRGRITDVGVGWLYFPRRLWDGPTFELGMLHRSLDTTVDAEDDLVERDGRTIATRALLGWSWLIRDRVFLSFAMGASNGYTFGTQIETTGNSPPRMTTTGRFGEWTTEFEGYVRFGVAFGGGS